MNTAVLECTKTTASRKIKRKTKNSFCYCCGTRQRLSDHHLKPRAEGGTDHPDNRVTVCSDCHDEVEGPADGAWERVIQFKAKIKSGRVAKTRQERLNEERDCEDRQQEYERDLAEREKRIFQLAGGAPHKEIKPAEELNLLRAKRRSLGYLDAVDGRKYWSLAFGEEQARLLFDAPTEEYVQSVVVRACGQRVQRAA